jgi:putative transposase
MPRSLLIRSETHAYHVMSRCNNKSHFPLPLNEVWTIAIRELKRAHEKKKLQVHAFVLMPNHFHLLCHTPEANLDHIMRDFLRNMSVTVTARAGAINHLWGSRYRRTLVDSERYYRQVYRYVLQNPLRAGLVRQVEDYRFSTLNTDLPFPLTTFVESDLCSLNQEIAHKGQQLIQLGLKKAQFDVSKRKLRVWEKEFGPKGE